MDDDDALGSQPDFGSQPSALGSQDPAAAAASDALLLKHALMNERAAPELLPYEADLVERVQLQLDHQEREIAEAERDRARELLRTIFTLELSRVRYMLRAYLRARLLKLERHVMHALDAPGARARLSPLEDAYAEKFLVLQGSHLKRAVADKLPDAFSSLVRQASAHAAPDMIPAPDRGRHVLCRVLRDLGRVQVYEDGGTHELAAGDLYVMRYRMLAPLLAQGAVQLI